MKVLVVGAGAVGGYFGGRLQEKGVDVTFLVREGRRRQLAEQGLVIKSVHGDVRLEPAMITRGEAAGPFDLVLLAMKAYHLEEGMEDVAPYIGEQTVVLPLLNGMAHMDKLKQRFGEQRVLGGLCFVESTLNEQGEIVQTSKVHELVYGEWDQSRSPRMEALMRLFDGARATFTFSERIVRDMWHKYLFIVTMSGMTTLMNASVGPICESPYGLQLTRQLFEEAAAIMRAHGAPISANAVEKQMEIFCKQPFMTKSSMLRDMEKGLPVEADHLQGYLLALAGTYGLSVPLLQIVYNNLKVYERKRAAQA